MAEQTPFLKLNVPTDTDYVGDDLFWKDNLEKIDTFASQGGGQAEVPSNVILFEDWVDGETVVIDTSTGGAPTPDTTAPALTITPATTFSDAQNVTMSVNETAIIWYTVDGSDPVSSGTRVQYTTAVTLTATTTVKAYAVDTAGNASAVQTVTYSKTIASGTILFQDSFDRTDSADLGSNWTELTTAGFAITSNLAVADAATSADRKVVRDVGYSDGIAIEVTNAASAVTNRIVFRALNANSCFAFAGDSTKYVLFKWNNSATAVSVAEYTGKGTALNDISKVELNGSNIKCYVNGVLAIDYTDTFNQSATSHGIGSYLGTVKLNDFKVTKL